MAKSKLADGYIVLSGAVGTYDEGAFVDPKSADTGTWEWARLERIKALRPATGAEVAAAHAATEETDEAPAATGAEPAAGGPTQSEETAKTDKEPVVGTASPTLSTGQPGGAPLAADAGKK